MVISIDSKNSFDKIQHPFMNKKSLIKLLENELYLYIIKVTGGKPTTYIILSGIKVKAFLPRSSTR